MGVNHEYPSPITSLVVIPSPVTLTGTVTSSITTVKGDGSTPEFWRNIRPGDWIWSAVNSEFREVRQVEHNGRRLAIDSPFTLDLVAETLMVIRKSNNTTISLTNAGGADGTIDGNIFLAGATVTIGQQVRILNQDRLYQGPVLVDGTGTSITVLKMI